MFENKHLKEELALNNALKEITNATGITPNVAQTYEIKRILRGVGGEYIRIYLHQYKSSEVPALVSPNTGSQPSLFEGGG